MTTTVAFLTRNCAVLGCDSLATASTSVLSPWEVLSAFYKVENNRFVPQTDEHGNLVFPDVGDIFTMSSQLPTNQLPSYTKMFHLGPAKVGVMFAGIAVISERSMRNLVDEFLAVQDNAEYLRRTYTVTGVTRRLKDHFSDRYSEAFTNEPYPAFEITVAGYSSNKNQPEARKLVFQNGTVEEVMSLGPRKTDRARHGFLFGGQFDVIERVTRGMDFDHYMRFIARAGEILSTYQDKLQAHVAAQGFADPLPGPDHFGMETEIRELDWIQGDYVDPAAFSEQAAIDYVDFLVDLMIKSQHFGDRVPTVGGDIHIAIITKRSGFKWISKEEYTYRGNAVKKES